jgi:hypothetical protein
MKKKQTGLMEKFLIENLSKKPMLIRELAQKWIDMGYSKSQLKNVKNSINTTLGNLKLQGYYIYRESMVTLIQKNTKGTKK